jgi:predicted nucleic acid-binding protein
MRKYFVDSNVFLRFYTADDVKQQAAAQEIFLEARAGKINLFCGPPVFFEVAWVLRSCYKISDMDILDKLESMLAIPNLHVFDSDRVKRAISLARKSKQSYADAYIAVTAKDEHIGVVTFNKKHFVKLDVLLYPIESEAAVTVQWVERDNGLKLRSKSDDTKNNEYRL